MHRVFFLTLALFFFAASCNRPTGGKLLPEKRMADLLAEVHLLDGYLNTLAMDSSRRVIDGLYEQLFAKYGIDSASFRENVSHYLGNPLVSKELYVDVTDKLKEMERQLHVEDSIRTAFAADSMRQASHYLKLAEDARKLILEAPGDSLPYDHFVVFPKLMEAIDISVPRPNMTVPPKKTRKLDIEELRGTNVLDEEVLY